MRKTSAAAGAGVARAACPWRRCWICGDALDSIVLIVFISR